MSTDLKPLQGRHRAAVDAPPPLRALRAPGLPILLGELAVVLLFALVVWRTA